MKVYQHLFFDLDHTLWDFDTNAKKSLAICFDEYKLQETLQCEFDDFADKYIYYNHRLWALYEADKITSAELKWKRMYLAMLDFKVANEKLSHSLSDCFLEHLPLQGELFPHTHEILTYLKEKEYDLYLITNGFELVQQNKLKHSNLHQYFSHMITSEASNSLKPKKEIFDYALKVTRANQKKSIMIGDNLTADVGGALNAGWDAIFVNHINAQNTQKSTYEIKHLKELENIF